MSEEQVIDQTEQKKDETEAKVEKTEVPVKTEAELATEAKQHQFDKDRQQEQQELGNSRRRIEVLEAEKAYAETKEQTADPEVENPLETLKTLEVRQAELEQKNAVIEQQLSNTQAQAVYSKHLSDLDTQYGADNRNAALANAKTEALERGYSLVGNDCPGTRELCDLVKMGYLEAAKSKPPTATATPAPKADTGRAGQALTQSDRITGTPEEVLEALKNRGQFKNLTIDA